MRDNSTVFRSPEGKAAILKIYDMLLEQWPVPHENLVLPTRCGDTFVIASGDKSMPPLFLLHGSSSNSAMWIGDVTEYCKNYRVYAVDLPGEPGHSADRRPDLASSAFSDWMSDVMAGLSVEKASFVGISLGGWLAVKFAAAHPEKVEKLALLCPAGIGPQKISAVFASLGLLFTGKKGAVRAVKKVLGSEDIADWTIEYCLLIAKNFKAFRGKVPVFQDAELRRLTFPVLLIAGGKDALIDSVRSIARAQQCMPGVKTVLLPEAGHGLLDQRDRILAFLRE